MSAEKCLILLIEDNPADAVLVREAFDEAGVECTLSVVRDGAEAVAFFQSLDADDEIASPDLILLDLNLPKVGGAKVLERLRASPRCRNTGVLIVSSSGAPSDRAQARELGATEYFRKPSSLDEFMQLGAVVQRLLKK